MDYRYPKYSYDASTSTPIIRCMAFPVHESLIQNLLRRISRRQSNSPGIHSKESLLPRTRLIGALVGSTTDLPKSLISLSNSKVMPGSMNQSSFLQVRLSETYDQLVDDAKLWLEGHKVPVVVLAKFKENPKCKCPTPPNLGFEGLDRLGIPKNSSKI